MGEKPDQIEQHIYETRSELGENIQELQSKVKHAVDWRAQFEERPWTMVGLAFGGGVLLSALMGGTRRPRYSGARRREQWRSERSHREYTDNGRTNERSDKASETWNRCFPAAKSTMTRIKTRRSSSATAQARTVRRSKIRHGRGERATRVEVTSSRRRVQM